MPSAVDRSLLGCQEEKHDSKARMMWSRMKELMCENAACARQMRMVMFRHGDSTSVDTGTESLQYAIKPKGLRTGTVRVGGGRGGGKDEEYDDEEAERGRGGR